MRRNITLFILLIFSYSRTHGQNGYISKKDEREFIKWINKKRSFEVNKLKLDGFYNNETFYNDNKERLKKFINKDDGTIDSIGYNLYRSYADLTVCEHGLFFFTNGIIMETSMRGNYKMGGNYNRISEYLSKYNRLSEYLSKDSVIYQQKNGLAWGIYELNNDTVTVGILGEATTRWLPRYQKKLEFYQGVLKDSNTIINWHQIPPYPKNTVDGLDFTLSSLKFVSFPAKKNMKPAKAWINKYRQK